MLDVLWVLWELAVNLCQAFICVHFIISSFHGECKLTNVKNTHIIGVIIQVAVVTALNYVTDYEGVLGLIYVLFYFAFSVIFLRGKLWKKIYISIITVICLISTAALTANIFLALTKDDPSKIYSEHSFERIVFMAIGTAVYAYVFALLKRIINKNENFLKTKEWVLILSVLGISFVLIAMIQTTIINSEIDPGLLMGVEFGIIIINILCLSITGKLNETHSKEAALLIEKKQSEYNREYARNVKEQYEQTRRIRHDIKQYAVTLLTFIQEKKFDAAEELAKKQAVDISRDETIIRVDNDFVNAILNTKLSFARSQGINVFCTVENGISGIEGSDLCNMLGNLLDNAITASENCDKDLRLIEVNIFTSGSQLVVIVKNSIQSSVLNANPDLESTKQDPEEHGFGIKTIKYIAEKYDGTTDFYEEGMTFISRIELHKTSETK